MKLSMLTAIALALGVATWANADWSQIQNEAKGQTVYFNAWGGNEATNAYIAWAAAQAKTRYGIEVRHVKIADTAEVVKRVQTEVSAGRTTDGSIDLMWVNGEDFRNLKDDGLLFGPWAVFQRFNFQVNTEASRLRDQATPRNSSTASHP